MKERILAFLQNENKSYAQFAEEIGVQPSGISHILSGRNNPSLDFIVKMLLKYPTLSAEWLLFGRGEMYKYMAQPSLFDTEPQMEPDKTSLPVEVTDDQVNTSEPPEKAEDALNIRETGVQNITHGGKKLFKVLFFYSDNTFSEYRPE
ncbi:MAG TPA: helix-turn-helix transcriptional regulator [Bacteroidales bacterium]|nr:helix-turn-helix transcriptional regulator [Bacteroidales bacterium]